MFYSIILYFAVLIYISELDFFLNCIKTCGKQDNSWASTRILNAVRASNVFWYQIKYKLSLNLTFQVQYYHQCNVVGRPVVMRPWWTCGAQKCARPQATRRGTCLDASERALTTEVSALHGPLVGAYGNVQLQRIRWTRKKLRTWWKVP